jgi:hypothetical protein
MGELYAAYFAKDTALETVSVRYFNVFGPRQSLLSDYASVIPLFIRNVVEGIRPTIFGDGTQTRDFTYVDNIVEAILRSVNQAQSQRTQPENSVPFPTPQRGDAKARRQHSAKSHQGGGLISIGERPKSLAGVPARHRN